MLESSLIPVKNCLLQMNVSKMYLELMGNCVNIHSQCHILSTELKLSIPRIPEVLIATCKVQLPVFEETKTIK